MAARAWAKLILNRRRDLINDYPKRTAAAETPQDAAREPHYFDNPRSHMHGAYHHSEGA